jgi:hypothetical protein
MNSYNLYCTSDCRMRYTYVEWENKWRIFHYGNHGPEMMERWGGGGGESLSNRGPSSCLLRWWGICYHYLPFPRLIHMPTHTLYYVYIHIPASPERGGGVASKSPHTRMESRFFLGVPTCRSLRMLLTLRCWSEYTAESDSPCMTPRRDCMQSLTG